MADIVSVLADDGPLTELIVQHIVLSLQLIKLLTELTYERILLRSRSSSLCKLLR